MMTRTIPLLTLLLILVAAWACAETVAGLPLHIQKLDSGAIRVWVGDHISSTATVAIATRKGLVIIDTLGYPDVDRELRRVIARELGRDDFKYLINTHEHGDHTGGNAVYADCTIVGHELVAAGMARNEADRSRIIEWQTTRIAELEAEIAGLAPGAAEAAALRENLILNRLGRDVAVANAPGVPPTRTFSNRMVLDLGDRTFELFYIGGMHSASDIAILVPELGLLMTGDTMADVWLTDTPGCLASFMARPGIHHDFPLMLENWNALIARGDAIKTRIPGHWNGELTAGGCEARVRYVEALWSGTKQAVEAGSDLDTILADYRLADRFPTLVDSPGCSQGNTYSTLVEMWSEISGQTSAAVALYDLLEAEAGESAIRAVVAQRGAESPSYFFMEGQINGYGYRFLQSERAEQAVAMFRINVELFPESWNVYDSLGEALYATGMRDQAIAMYEKSLELNPESTSGRDMLERIRSEARIN